MTKCIAIALAVLVTTGCTGMLPKRYTVTHNQWTDYDQVMYIGNSIRAGQSLDDLKTRVFWDVQRSTMKIQKNMYNFARLHSVFTKLAECNLDQIHLAQINNNMQSMHTINHI